MPRGNIPQERMPEITAGYKRIAPRGGWSSERTHRVWANESEAYKRASFHTLFDHTHLPQEEVEQMTRLTGQEDPEQAREHLTNVMSDYRNRAWLQKVLLHENALAGTNAAAGRFAWKNRAYVILKGLKGRVGFRERIRGMFGGTPGTARHDIAGGILSAIEATGGLAAARQPPARQGEEGRREGGEEGERTPTANEAAVTRVLEKYLTPRKINLMEHVKEGMRLKYSHLSERDRAQFTGSPQMYDYHSSQLVHRSQPFISEMHGLGFSDADVDAFATHALNARNYTDFRKRMAVALKEGSRKIESADETAPHMLSKFFLAPTVSVYDADGNQLSNEQISAHNINELHRKVAGELLPLSPEQKSAYSFFTLAQLSKEGNPEAAKSHLKRLVRNVRDELTERVNAIADMQRGRKFGKKQAGNFMLDLMQHGGLSLEEARGHANRVLQEHNSRRGRREEAREEEGEEEEEREEE